jgi:hypothetical protein
MSEQVAPPEQEAMTEDENEKDEILNDETTRALREWGRRCYAIGAGLFAAGVMLIPTAVTAVRPVGVLFHLAVVFVISLSLPVVAAYVAVRTYGLSHHEAVSASKYAVREAAAATTTLGAHQRAEQSGADTDDGARIVTDRETDHENDDTQ